LNLKIGALQADLDLKSKAMISIANAQEEFKKATIQDAAEVQGQRDEEVRQFRDQIERLTVTNAGQLSQIKCLTDSFNAAVADKDVALENIGSKFDQFADIPVKLEQALQSKFSVEKQLEREITEKERAETASVALQAKVEEMEEEAKQRYDNILN
jgi:hypothetical protein